MTAPTDRSVPCRLTYAIPDLVGGSRVDRRPGDVDVSVAAGESGSRRHGRRVGARPPFAIAVHGHGPDLNLVAGARIKVGDGIVEVSAERLPDVLHRRPGTRADSVAEIVGDHGGPRRSTQSR